MGGVASVSYTHLDVYKRKVLDCLEVDSWQEVRLEECDAAMPEMWRCTDMG